MALVSLRGHIVSLEGGLTRLELLVQHSLPCHAAQGCSTGKGWKLLLGEVLGRLEKSHVLSPPQDHNTGLPRPKRALRAALGLPFP